MCLFTEECGIFDLNINIYYNGVVICLCLTQNTLEDDSALITRYIDYIDMIEMRVDTLQEDQQKWELLRSWTVNIRQAYSFKIIFTIRLVRDGGNWNKSEIERRNLLQQALASGLFDFVDIESDIERVPLEGQHNRPISDNAWIEQSLQIAHNNTQIILSQHIFDSEVCNIPRHWGDDILSLSQEYPSCIIKSAISCNNTEMLCDFFSQAQMLKEKIPNKYIIAPMGLYGVPARILRIHSGSFLTFSSATDESSFIDTQGAHTQSKNILGHIDPKTLVETYQYRNIGHDTQIFGIIGNPVMHSQSPHLHNEYFKQGHRQDLVSSSSNGYHTEIPLANKVYIHLPINQCHSIKTLAQYINLRGLSVTIPFKQDIIQELDKCDKSSIECKSCNTVVINEHHEWWGYNTDIAGFLRPLYETLKLPEFSAKIFDAKDIHTDLAAYNICIIGAGGSAFAIAYALAKLGAELLIVNRTKARAERLVKDLCTINNNYKISCTDISNYEQIAKKSDIIVQTSAVGMNDIGASPLPHYEFSGREIVYDIIYTPPNTRLLREAKEKGCNTISGKRMFLGQGFLQSEYFKTT